MRRHKGDVAAATARFKSSRAGSRGVLNCGDGEDMPVICPTCQIHQSANSSTDNSCQPSAGNLRQVLALDLPTATKPGLAGHDANFLDYFPKFRMLAGLSTQLILSTKEFHDRR
jgi:hypothetical protein